MPEKRAAARTPLGVRAAAKTAIRWAPPKRLPDRLGRLYIDRLRTPVGILGVIGDLRPLFEGRALGESALVDENVLPALVGLDEAKALLVVEPLDGSGCHSFTPVLGTQWSHPSGRMRGAHGGVGVAAAGGSRCAAKARAQSAGDVAQAGPAPGVAFGLADLVGVALRQGGEQLGVARFAQLGGDGPLSRLDDGIAVGAAHQVARHHRQVL